MARSRNNQTEHRHHQVFRRDSGYNDHHCQSTGLEIFAFLLFLVYLLDLLRNVLMNAMLNVMINDQTVTALQGKNIIFLKSTENKILFCPKIQSKNVKC